MLYEPDRLWSLSAFDSGLLWHRDATASAKKRAKKKKNGPSYKQMMAGVIETGKSYAELRAEHRARLKAKYDSKETRVTAQKFERI